MALGATKRLNNLYWLKCQAMLLKGSNINKLLRDLTITSLDTKMGREIFFCD